MGFVAESEKQAVMMKTRLTESARFKAAIPTTKFNLSGRDHNAD